MSLPPGPFCQVTNTHDLGASGLMSGWAASLLRDLYARAEWQHASKQAMLAILTNFLDELLGLS